MQGGRHPMVLRPAHGSTRSGHWAYWDWELYSFKAIQAGPRSWVGVVTWPPVGGIPWTWDQHIAASDQATEHIGTRNYAVSRPSWWCIRFFKLAGHITHSLTKTHVIMSCLQQWPSFDYLSLPSWSLESIGIGLVKFLSLFSNWSGPLVQLLSKNWNNSFQWSNNSLPEMQQVTWACAWSKWQRKYMVFIFILGVVKEYLVTLPLPFPHPQKALN